MLKVSGTLFLGEFDYSIDKQRRVAVPSSWRGDDLSRFVILPGRDNTLQGMPAEKAAQMLKKLTSSSFANREASKALAMIGSYACECVCDKQGRICLSQKLLSYAKISEHVVFVGGFDSFQIWSKEQWSSQSFDVDTMLDVVQNLQEQPDEIGSALGNLMQNFR
ncbi:MAG: division/cell wall cluster transcriptional repressor MraZ [Lentisphaeria bacterium]